jgi:hypothetical protein
MSNFGEICESVISREIKDLGSRIFVKIKVAPTLQIHHKCNLPGDGQVE